MYVGITFLADAGLSAVQMMSHTKHRSQSVLQGYVDNSMQSKLTVSNALSTKRTIAESGIMLTYDFL